MLYLEYGFSHLERVGVIEGGTNVLAEGATLGPYVFESCAKLSASPCSH